jgi:hypothetical protein
MKGEDLIVGGMLSVVGGILAGGALARYEWIIQMPKARLLEATLGPSNARITLFVLGAGLLLLGLATSAGWMKRPSKKSSYVLPVSGEGALGGGMMVRS